MLPLTIPMVLLAGDRVKGWFKLSMWIFFNLLMVIVFGMLHQGGVVPSMNALNLRLKELTLAVETRGLEGALPVQIVSHKTYMAPRFLLAHDANNGKQ